MYYFCYLKKNEHCKVLGKPKRVILHHCFVFGQRCKTRHERIPNENKESVAVNKREQKQGFDCRAAGFPKSKGSFLPKTERREDGSNKQN